MIGRTDRPLRIAIIAPSRHPIAQPHAGGLEAAVWDRVSSLRRRGHRVTLIAAEGSDFSEHTPPELRLPPVAWTDPGVSSDTEYPRGYPDQARAALRHALNWLACHRDEHDLIENHTLFGEPIAAAATLGIPVITTLHTPPLPEMIAAAADASPDHRFVAVSAHTAAEWRAHGIDAVVQSNAIDTERWSLGAGGRDLVWFGRIVPEKAPHLAIEAARLAGRRIVLAGRVGDAEYFASQIEPRLGRAARYAGPLRQLALARLVGRSACALVTPMWEEPFGLVLAEALATGTPVAAFHTGGVPEVLAGSPGARLVPMGDVAALADAAADLSAEATAARRRATRRHAVRRFSLEARVREMELGYLRVLAEAGGPVTTAVPA